MRSEVATSPSFAIAVETPSAPGAAALLAASDAHSAALYPPESNHVIDAEALAGPNVRFLMARYADGAALGCGAVVLGTDGTAEVKRMFVAEAARGLGVGLRLLGALEAEARVAGARVMRLETGVRQPAAIRLYERAGFTRRGPFGAYTEDPLSVFMEKPLS